MTPAAPGEKVTFELSSETTTRFSLVGGEAATGVSPEQELAGHAESSGHVPGASGSTEVVGTVVPADTAVRFTWTLPEDPGELARLRVTSSSGQEVARFEPTSLPAGSVGP